MAVYLLANLVGIGLGVYKVNAMGLLPTSQSDWLEFMVAREVSDNVNSGGGISLPLSSSTRSPVTHYGKNLQLSISPH